MAIRNVKSKAKPDTKAKQKQWRQSPAGRASQARMREKAREATAAYHRDYWIENKEKMQAQRASKRSLETPEEREVRLAKQREYTRRYRAKLAQSVPSSLTENSRT